MDEYRHEGPQNGIRIYLTESEAKALQVALDYNLGIIDAMPAGLLRNRVPVDYHRDLVQNIRLKVAEACDRGRIG